MLILAGKSGCGKTLAMRKTSAYLIAARTAAADLAHWPSPPSTHWENWPALARSVSEGGKDAHMRDLMRDTMDADILFLDDVGADSDKYRSGETVDALCQLLNRREKRWTMITTNFIPSEWAKQLDARVADRFWRNSVVCDLSDSPSYALKPGGVK